MARRVPLVERGALNFPNAGSGDHHEAGKSPILVDSAGWFEWLAAGTTTSFAFCPPGISFTATKERRARGGSYWYAYCRQAGRRRKAYLGRTADLTLERLQQVAAQFARSESTQPSPLPALGRVGPVGPPPGADRLVGRRRELAALRRRLDACLAGRGSLVLIGGEAGIGKTALAEAFARQALARGATVLGGRCYDLSTTPPYGPWTDIVRALPEADATSVLESLLDDGDQGGTSQTVRFGAVLSRLAEAARGNPHLLVLDDVHWADLASLDLLRFLGRQLAPLRVLLLATYRTDEVDPTHPLHALVTALVREADPLRLDLPRLDETDLRRLVGGRYRLAAEDDDRLTAYLLDRADGNPFFIQELLRALEQENVLRSVDGRWRLGDPASVRLPPLLRQVIDRRLRQLSPVIQEALAIAAVIGQEVLLGLWATVAGLDEPGLLEVVEVLVAAHLLTEVAGGCSVRFTHAIVRQALHEGLLPRHGPARQATWHRRVAEALAAAPEPDPDAVADHFKAVADPRAADWLLAAGLRAERALAWQAAADRFEAVLPLVDSAGARPLERAILRYRLALLRLYGREEQSARLVDEARRLAIEAGDLHLAATAEFHRGYLDCAMGRVGQGIDQMERAVADLAVRPDARTKADPPGRLDSLRHRSSDLDPLGLFATWLALVGRLEEADGRGARRVTLGQPADDEPMAGLRSAGLQAAYILAYTGRPEAARREFARLRATYRAAGNQLYVAVCAVDELRWVALPYAADDVAGRRRLSDLIEEELRLASGIYDLIPTRWMRLPLLVLEGQWVEARTLAAAAWASGGGAQHLGVALLGVLAREQDDAELASTLIREQLPAGPATPPGETVFMTSLALQRVAASLALDSGQFAAARAWLAAHDRWIEWSGATLGRAEGALGWAEYHRSSGDRVAAERAARAALRLAAEPRQPLAQLAAERLLGRLATDAVRTDAAAAHLARALTLTEACAAPFERAQTLLALADLSLAQRAPERALRQLDQVTAICTPLGAARLLAQAAVTAGAAESERRRPAYPAGLSSREVDVLRLLADGRTNNQIAAALHLSLPTVKSHVAQVLRKTGAQNRAAATAFAVRHGLA